MNRMANATPMTYALQEPFETHADPIAQSNLSWRMALLGLPPHLSCRRFLGNVTVCLTSR